MKQSLCLLLWSILPLRLTAQYYLTSDRNAYRAADQIVKQQVEFKDPGSSLM